MLVSPTPISRSNGACSSRDAACASSPTSETRSQLVTKNGLVARDIDILAELAEHEAVAVNVSVTTLDAGLQRLLEPRASHPHERLKAIERLSQAGIPVGVLVAPIIPGLTEHEIPAILAAAAEAGAGHAGHIVLRLPRGVKAPLHSLARAEFPGPVATRS